MTVKMEKMRNFAKRKVFAQKTNSGIVYLPNILDRNFPLLTQNQFELLKSEAISERIWVELPKLKSLLIELKMSQE